MARLVYASRFDVAGADAMVDVLSTYRDWIVDSYRKKRTLAEFDLDPEFAGDVEGLPSSHALSSSVFHDGGEHAIRVNWSFPDDNDEGLRWANEVRVGQFGDRCGVEHLISIQSVDYRVSPAKLKFGSPRAIREICTKSSTFVGEMQVRAEPYDLVQDGLNDLLHLLMSDLRKLPVVLLSPYARGELNKIDPRKLARNLAGVAVVVRIEDPELTWDFADEIGRQLSCFHGAARIYWPGFTFTSDPRSHRLYFGAWIDRFGAEFAARTIERAIFAVAAFRYAPDRRITDLIRRVQAHERQQLFAKKKETGDDFWSDYEETLDKLAEAEVKIEKLAAENANLKANQQVFLSADGGSPDEQGVVEEAAEPSFSSVAEAVGAAAHRCKNVEILNTAISAAANSPFQRPFDIYKALTDLDDIVVAWAQNRDEKGSGGDLLQHLRDHGWGKRSSMHISDTTRGKFRSHYEFEYQGKKELFEPHITLGAGDPNSCASIHFLFDQDRLKMIVGHVGKHLPNKKT